MFLYKWWHRKYVICYKPISLDSRLGPMVIRKSKCWNSFNENPTRIGNGSSSTNKLAYKFNIVVWALVRIILLLLLGKKLINPAPIWWVIGDTILSHLSAALCGWIISGVEVLIVAADNRCCCRGIYFECYSCCSRAGSYIFLERHEVCLYILILVDIS